MSSRRIFNIIVVTSTFWFSVTVLVLMFNSEVTRDSLTMLNGPIVMDKEHHYMQGAGVNPLRPVQKHIKYPWEKDSSLKSEEKNGMLSDAAKAVLRGVMSPDDKSAAGLSSRSVYDASLHKRTNPGGLGENGQAAYLTSEEDKKLSEERFGEHSFNWVLSDRISLDRTLQDVRSEG